MTAGAKQLLKAATFGLGALLGAGLAPSSGSAAFHLWRIQELYSNPDGSIQFLELAASADGETQLNGRTLTITSSGGPNGPTNHMFTFDRNLTGSTIASIIIATPGYAALTCAPAADFSFSMNRVFDPAATSVTVSLPFTLPPDTIVFGSGVPTDGTNSVFRNLSTAQSTPKNQGGVSGTLEDCSDANFCDGEEICANSGACGPVATSPCPALCNEGTDACVECLAPTDCPNDSNPCTDRTCNAGACGFSNNTAACDDGNFCTVTDLCGGGTCGGSGDPCSGPTPFCNEGTNMCNECMSPTDCPNDANVCTDRACNAGSCAQTNNTAACDDGNFCTATDVCAGGTCGGSGNPCSGGMPVCDDGGNTCVQCLAPTDCPNDANPCTDRVCNAGTCSQMNNTAACDDGNFCTITDLCGGGTCGGSGDPCSGPTPFCNEDTNMCNECMSPTDCPNDANICTDRACNAGSCAQTNNTAACDDGNFCTATDVCAGGTCGGSGNPCSGTIPICDESGNTCIACSTDAACEDGDPCTENDCDGSGACVASNAVAGTPCADDGLFCTGTEACSAGACVGAGDPCASGQQCSEADDNCVRLCEDGNPAASGVCPEDEEPEADAGSVVDAGSDAGPADAGGTTDAGGMPDAGAAGGGGAGSGAPGEEDAALGDAGADGGSGGGSSDCSCHVPGGAGPRAQSGLWLALAGLLVYALRRGRRRRAVVTLRG